MTNPHHLDDPSRDSRYIDKRGPYWKRAHRGWPFWFAIAFMLTAMIIYLCTDDLAWRIRLRPPQPVSGATQR
jgi:hypothetical protein